MYLHLVQEYIVSENLKENSGYAVALDWVLTQLTQEPKALFVGEGKNPPAPLVNAAGMTLATNLFNYKIGSLFSDS